MSVSNIVTGDAAVSAKRTAANSTVILWVLGAAGAIFGWDVDLSEAEMVYIAPVVGIVLGVGYRLSRLITTKFPTWSWVLFASGKEPAGLVPTGVTPDADAGG